MASADHYCKQCDTHFDAPPEQHAATYHDDGLFLGVENGDFRDYND